MKQILPSEDLILIFRTIFRMILLILFFFSPLTMAFSYTLEITEQEIQDKVSAMMPMEKKKYFVNLKLSKPKIELIKESNEIGIIINIAVSAPGGIKGSGKTNIRGSLSYNKEKGAFYLNNPKIVSLNINNLSEKYIPKTQDLLQLALTKTLSKYPVYKFKDDNLKNKLAKATLESIEVKNKKLLITLGVFN